MRLAPAAALALLATSAFAIQRPPRAERLAQCQADANHAKYRCHAKPKAIGSKKMPLNINYGWYVGKSHPLSDRDPPHYTKLLNGLDQCAWFHDRGGWRWNPRTRVCENWAMCSNTIGLFRCLDAYKPETPDETEAKSIAMRSIGRVGEICIRKLYKNYGVQFVRDRHGSQWLSDKALHELSDAFTHCKPGQTIPGFDVVLKRLKRALNFKRFGKH